ncbi:MAG TPA: recombinase RecA [bacterium]|jgi:recombination protein RecA|nr:recombinase RecA [bacterium]HOG38522.1 recombinase RecA [bacterium]HQI03472.1 recombinase RecA [bacterium]
MAKKEKSKTTAINDKRKAADQAIEQIREKFGQGSIMKMGAIQSLDVDSISTGCLSLDIALGVGGVPRGRVIELFGPESSGKTTLAQHIVAETQKKGGVAAFIDVEHALDPVYAKKIGINIDDLILSQPDAGEQALEILETLIRSNAIDVIVVDSVAALVPQAEIDGEMGDQQIGLQARLMSKALRKITPIVSKSRTVVIFINQIRMKIGVFFGNPETTPGGKALKFYSSVRIEVRRAAVIKRKEEIIGNRVNCKIVKNKVAAPFTDCQFDILYNEGISMAGDILDVGMKYNILSKTGNTVFFGKTKLGVGREDTRLFIKNNKDIANQIREEVLKKVKEQRELE